MIKKMPGIIFLFVHFLFPQQLPSIAVLDLIAKGIAEDEASVLTDKLRGELFQTGRYQVIERSVMDEVLKEQGFQQTGCVSSECAVEAGQLIGVQYMVSGSIGRIEQTFLLSIGLINVATGEIEKSVQKELTGSLTDVLKEGIPHVVKELTKQLSVTDAKTDDQTTLSQKPDTKDSEKESSRKGKIVVSISYSTNIGKASFKNDDDPPVQDDVTLTVHGFNLRAGYRFSYQYLGAVFSFHSPKSYELSKNGHTLERQLWGIGVEWFFERLQIRDIFSLAPGIALGYWELNNTGSYVDEPEKTADFSTFLLGGPKAKLELGWKRIHFLMTYTLQIVASEEQNPARWNKSGENTYIEGGYFGSRIVNTLCFGLSFQFN